MIIHYNYVQHFKCKLRWIVVAIFFMNQRHTPQKFHLIQTNVRKKISHGRMDGYQKTFKQRDTKLSHYLYPFWSSNLFCVSLVRKLIVLSFSLFCASIIQSSSFASIIKYADSYPMKI